MKSKLQIANILSVLVILAMLIAPISNVTFAASAEKATTPPKADGQPAATNETAGTSSDIYLIRLEDAPLASYQGSVSGLDATSPLATGARKLDANSPASQAYRQYLSEKHAQVISAMEQIFGRTVEVVYEYFAANNGFAVRLSPIEAKRVSGIPGVIFVQADRQLELQTDYGPAWIGAPGVWDGSTTGGASTMGEGIIVGVIDTGINPANPSFAEVGPIDGYVHVNPYGSGNYTPGSYCDTVDPTFCNDKLIGAWGFPDVNGGDPTDYDGHGSHTASTSAGNIVTATLTAPTTNYVARISGVAPHANIIAYAACCADSSLAAAYDQIIIDGVDVVNHSIGATGCVASDPWTDFIEVAFLEARNAGIFVANSAGNCGPGSTTLGSPAEAPWLTAVGASTHNRSMINSLINMAGGTPPPDMDGVGITSGYGPAPIVHASAFGDSLCLNPFPAGTWTNGEIVMCDRGINARVDKGANVLAGGAGGMVLGNTDAQGEGVVADPHFLPALHIGDIDADVVRAWLGAPPVAPEGGLTATISGLALDLDPSNGDIMAGFSSRGPNQAISVIKPDVTAPGQDIFAAYGADGVVEWNIISGTSMASPHVAGAAALLTALHPTWSPAEIQSALMTTAWDTMLKEDGVTPADRFDIGSGRVDLGPAAMAGLVLDETNANYLAANPAIGGDPRTLNIASMEDWDCASTCVFTRTVTSPLAYAVNWDVTTDTPAGVTISVVPNNFTLAGGASQELVVTVDATGAAVAEWQFAKINLTPSEPVVTVAAPIYTAPAFKGPLPEGAVDTASDADANAPSVVSPLSNYQVPNVVLYDNGPLVTHPGGGSGGADESRLQSTTLGMGTIGFGHQVSANNRVADDFTITDPDGWDLDDIIFYAYQTGSTTVSTMTAVNLQIWDGPPNGGGTVIWGDTTTNVMVSTIWSNDYRVTETTIGNTTRPVMANTTDIGGLHLDPGTYWLDWQTNGSLASGPWAPPITILGQAVTGNGLQSIAGVWGAALDGGTGTPAQGFPFTIVGTVTPPPSTIATYCASPNLVIPDLTTVSTNMSVPDSGNIVDVNVAITGTHTWVGDLIFTVANPSASSIVVDRPGVPASTNGCSSNNFASLLDDEGVDGPVENQCSATPPALFGNPTPNNPLSALDGSDINGTWTLTVSDNAGGDTGVVQQWCVTVDTGSVPPAYVEPAAAHFPVAVINPGAPTIAVTPDTVESTQGTNQVVTETLTISNTGTGDLNWSIFEDADAPLSATGYWSDNFDSYPTGQNLHGVGGWKGWDNSPAATAFTSAAQAISAPNSVDITGGSDLVHEYVGASSGQWTYTAWQYVPSTMTGLSYFILLNTYADGGPNNWSVQVLFDASANTVTNDGLTGGTLTLLEDQWVELRVEIDLDADTQDFYYNNQLLYSATWTDEQGAGNGALNIGAVDLFANNATSVFYDDISLTTDTPPIPTSCDFPNDVPWLSVSPSSGTTTGPGADDVAVVLDSTGLALGVYTGTLCVESNDVTNPLVTVPVTLTVDTLPPVIEVAPSALANTQGPDVTTTWDLVISNTGEADLDWTIDEDAIPNVLYSTVTIPSAPAGTVTIGDGLFNLSSSGATGSATHTLTAPAGSTTITHSATQNVVVGSIACTYGAGLPHADNSYIRSFTLADFGITDPFDVTEVSFGVELATGAGADQPVTVNLYTWDTGDPFTFANFTLVGSSTANVPDQTLSIYTVPVTGTISAGGTLVVEVFTPDGQTEGNRLFIGSNADGQTAPSYLASAPCGITEPTDIAAIGFPNMHIVMNVTGEIVPAAGVCVNPEDIGWASVSSTSGTTAGGSSSTVEVTFDSTGLSAGVYTGTLCVGSNDLTNPLVTVPLTLTVDENADVSITKSAPAEVTVGDTFTYTLEVTNNGPATAISTTVTDTLPAGVTFVSASVGCTEAGGVVTCDLGDLASGATATVEIVVTADSAGTATNTASVASVSPDPDTTNNSDSADTTILEAPVEGFWIFLPIVNNQ